ncbi:hypothetical protein Tco_1346822 [Tanacetum coccineum]
MLGGDYLRLEARWYISLFWNSSVPLDFERRYLILTWLVLLFHCGVTRRMSWREFILAVGLHTAEEIGPTRFRTCWAESSRQIPDKGDQSVYWRGISLIACIIAGRIQAPEKVTVTDLFYLMGMDVNSFNIPYLLARYLRRFASGRKQGAMIFKAIVRDLPVIDIVELAVPALLQAPWPPHAAQDRTMPQRLARLENEVHGLRGSMAEYTSYSDYRIPYQRSTRHRTNDTSTSAPQQPDP